MRIDQKTKDRRWKTENNYFFGLLITIFIFLSLSAFANTKGFSQAEIANMSALAHEKVDSQAVQQWVQSIQHAATPYFNVSRNDSSSKRRAALMVFVSSSMPISSLHQYLIDGSKVGATLVLRGLINNSFQMTAKFIHQALMGTKGGFKVDPIVFKKLHITRVPAIVLFNANGLVCINQRDCVPNPEDYDRITGNVTIAYALREMANRGTADSRAAKQLLKKIRKATHV